MFSAVVFSSSNGGTSFTFRWSNREPDVGDDPLEVGEVHHHAEVVQLEARAWTRTRQLWPCSRSHLPGWNRIWCAALKTKSFEIS